MKKAEIKNHNSRPAVFIDGKPFPPYMATIRTLKDSKEIIFDRDYFENLGKSGIKIFFLSCNTEWLVPDALSYFDKEARMLLDAVPDAYIIPRVCMHPPIEWVLAHPEECLTYSDGSKPGVHVFAESYEADYPMQYSLMSSKWREDASVALEELWKKIMSLPYADRIIGAFFGAGGTMEWYNMLPVFNKFKNDGLALDHSDAFRREFSAYLKETYGTDDALAKAWGIPEATIENPPIPEAKQHYFVYEADKDALYPPVIMYSNNPPPPPYGNGTNLGSFIDFKTNRQVFDFYRVWHLGTARSITTFTSVIKRLTPDRLTGAFYGALGCNEYAISGSALGTVEIHKDPSIDFLAAPGVYENRLPGGCTGQREMQDSLAINGKLFLVEDDARTLAENRFFMDKYQIYTMEDSINVMKREFGRTMCEDVQAWWFDQLIGGRRFKYPEIYALIKEQEKIAKDLFDGDRAKGNEIALIVDEETVGAVSHQTTKDALEQFRNYEMAKVGAPIDLYYHNDMKNPNMPKYKLYVFVNTYLLTERERDEIKAKLKADGAVALWMYAPGFIDPNAKDPQSTANMEALTGIRFAEVDDKFDAIFRWNGEAHPISERLDSRELFGRFDRVKYSCLGVPNEYTYAHTYLYPLFYPDDRDAKVLARFLTSGYPSVAVKEIDGYTSVYYGSKFINSKTLREIARFAGCHIWSESDDTFYASDALVTHHASSSGKKRISFKFKASPYEVYEKKYYGHGVTEIEFDSALGETKTFILEKE